MSFIYTPMTADIVTPGHIKYLEKLRQDGFVVVGLLTDDALHGYKKPVMCYSDRKYILDTIAKGIGNVMIVKQDTLDPIYNLEFYECKFLASGDGFEDVELAAAKALNIELMDVKIHKEHKKRYSSSKIKDRIRQQKG